MLPLVQQEAGVDDNSRAMAATIVGAVVGGIAGYLFFTERGRALRREVEPALEDIVRELNSFRGTVEKVAGVATEGWKVLSEALGEGTEPHPRYVNPHQSSPF
jgi:gas vesicle protein